MSIHAEKIRLAKLLLETENPKIIESIKKIFLSEESHDFWDELSDEQKEEINKATQEIEEGKVVSYESFIEKHKLTAVSL
ncbi:hypothetical protein [Salibacter sp.]|uniref:hypothetical protein n=1 Tax=Salibacter sp. TaxID=2010995 RepID=UPI00286FB20A|nr:hypothetical protein [Salibacter sp.]MDR9488614.1 hypothetical protein [Salibacter sp.]